MKSMVERESTDIARDAMPRKGDDRRVTARLDRLHASAAGAAECVEGWLLGILVIGSAAVILAGFWSPLLAVAVAAPFVAAVAALRPGWTLALALNGFFLYLALLDLTGHGPRTLVTGFYYATLGAAMAWAIWRSRDVIRARIAARTALVSIWAVAALLLATWFLVNAAVFREGGDLARNLTALLVLSTLPAAALAFALTSSGIAQLRLGLVALGFVLVAADLVAFARGPVVDVGRFSPLEDLDPINAGLIPALGAMAAASLSPSSRRGYALQVVAVVVLAAASLVPGSRGPGFSLVAAMLALSVLRWRWSAVVPLIALVVGLTLGAAVSHRLDTSGYFAQGVEDVAAEVRSEKDGDATPGTSPVTISTFRMRKQWFEEAWRAFPDRPLFGHGIATLRDTTPESKALGAAGGLIYPHNDVAEAAYSLGVPGLVLFLVLIGVPGILLLLRQGRRRPERFALACGVFAFAFVQSNISGEIGADAALWSASALAVALYLDERRARPPRKGA